MSSSFRSSFGRLRTLLLIAALLVAAIGVAAPGHFGRVAAQEADQPVDAAQIGGRAYVPIVGKGPQGTPNAVAWLRPSANSINPGSFFGIKVLIKSTGTAPEPFVNVFVSYNTRQVDFQSATLVRGDFISTQPNGFTVQFNGPFAPGAERYADVLFRARSGVTNVDVQFTGNFNAANGKSGALQRIDIQIGQGGIRPSTRFSCQPRNNQGPLGINPGTGTLPFGTNYTFGAFRRDNGGCGYTFTPNVRVKTWIAQPTGPSRQLGISPRADAFGEVQFTYNSRDLLTLCPVNLCAFEMMASDGGTTLGAPFNSTRPAIGSAALTEAAPAELPEVAEADLVNPAQTARGGLTGVVSGSDGSPLADVLVVLVDPATDDVIRTELTDAAGQYVMTTGVPTGNFQVYYITSLGHNSANSAFVDTVVPVSTSETTVTTLNATLQRGGQISGRVTNDSGQPLQEVLALVYDATLNTIVSTEYTDADGAYTSDALPSGNYVVEFQAGTSGFDPSTGHVGEYHENQPLGAPPVPVTVTAPANTISVDGVLSRIATLGAIDGRVTAQDGGVALPDVTVIVRNAANGQQVAVETTDEDGRYHVLLPSGDYTVEFFTDVTPNLLSRSYIDAFAGPGPITVTAPNVVANINGVLARGGQISGTVTARDGAAPLPDVFVVVRNAQNQVVTEAVTDEQGGYTTPALANGSYTVQFQTATSASELTRGYKDASRQAVVSGPGNRSAPADIQLSR